MLKRVERLDWSGNYGYAPPRDFAVINLDHVVSVTVTEARGCGPFVLVKLVDGMSMTCVGTPDDFLPNASNSKGGVS